MTALLDDVRSGLEFIGRVDVTDVGAASVIEVEALKTEREGPRLRAALDAGCSTCVHAVLFGWWGPGHKGTHCTVCHRSWSGTAQAHCTACHRHFSRDSTAVGHRVNDQCRDPLTIMRNDGTRAFKVNETPLGPVFVRDVESSFDWARQVDESDNEEDQ